MEANAPVGLADDRSPVGGNSPPGRALNGAPSPGHPPQSCPSRNLPGQGQSGGWGRPRPCQVHADKVGARCSELRLRLFTTASRVCGLGTHVHVVTTEPPVPAECATLSVSRCAPPSFAHAHRISRLTGLYAQLTIASRDSKQHLSLSAPRTFSPVGASSAGVSRALRGLSGTPAPPTGCQDTPVWQT